MSDCLLRKSGGLGRLNGSDEGRDSPSDPSTKRDGTLPERLGIGLQNRGRRFESARYLN